MGDNFTKVPNDILEKLATTKLNGTQRRIIDVVMRSTIGWNKESHQLSLTFFHQKTGINKNTIKRELDELIKCNVIEVHQDATFNRPRTIGINASTDQWLLKGVQYSKKSTPLEKEDTQYSKKSTPEYSKKSTIKESTKRNIIKETTDYESVFDYYVSLDNMKKHKEYTKSMTNAIKKAMNDCKLTIDDCKLLLDRHNEVTKKTKNSEYPVKVQTLQHFFGRKAYESHNLICEEYMEGGDKFEKYLNNSNKNKSEPATIKDVEPIKEEIVDLSKYGGWNG